jgi:hypothetical protein
VQQGTRYGLVDDGVWSVNGARDGYGDLEQARRWQRYARCVGA